MITNGQFRRKFFTLKIPGNSGDMIWGEWHIWGSFHYERESLGDGLGCKTKGTGVDSVDDGHIFSRFPFLDISKSLVIANVVECSSASVSFNPVKLGEYAQNHPQSEALGLESSKTYQHVFKDVGFLGIFWAIP